MAASQTDKFRKLARRWVGQIGSGGVSDGTVTTIPLSSATNLPTDTGVSVVIDRVDANGTATPSLEETVTGVVSGSNLVNCVRGVEGTAQAHSAGGVVEVLYTNAQHGALIDGILVEHAQDGKHNKVNGNTVPSASDTVALLAASQVFTNKTLTTPVINGAVTGTITPPLTFYGTNFNAPEGFLINGKIVPSVASNNLTVAIKGMDGNDPSATNPVYVRIGGVVRSITSALSITANAGTNWCNAGSSELATKEIDYFVYLGYNAIDGVVLGFARIPYATLYSDFSTTTTNEKYCAISTITNAAAGDNYVNIGRFAATLSAGAGYTWTVPTFTAANLIQRPIYETRWLNWVPQYTPNAGAYSTTHLVCLYKLDGLNATFIVNAGTQTVTGAPTAVVINLPMGGKTLSAVPQAIVGMNYDGAGANQVLLSAEYATATTLRIRCYTSQFTNGGYSGYQYTYPLA